MPRAGWLDSEVRAVVRRALPALAQAGLGAVQLLILLIAANRLPGGIIAFHTALNFYYLVDALATTPVALSLLPRLARMHADGDTAGFGDTFSRGFTLGLFITIPAAVAYVILAGPLARAIAFGQMGATGVQMIAAALVPLSAGGDRLDRVHDRDVRVLRTEGHPVATAGHDVANRHLPPRRQHHLAVTGSPRWSCWAWPQRCRSPRPRAIP